MGKYNTSRLAVLLLTSGLALTGAAHAAPLAGSSAKTGAVVKAMPADSGVTVKLGKALLEEYFQTPTGPVLRELTPGGAQAAAKTPSMGAKPKA